jgi:hypothetical protein
MLEGKNTEEIRPLLSEFYSDENIETPGIEIDDWMQVLKVR